MDSQRDSRVLLLSRRAFDARMFQCGVYECEDVLAGMDSVSMAAPRARRVHYLEGLRHRALNRLRKAAGESQDFCFEIETTIVDRDFELFVAIFHFPEQVRMLDRLPGWRKRSRKAVCLLFELWSDQVEDNRAHLKRLAEFDRIFVANPFAVDAVAEASGRPCEYWPFGVDAAAFCPYPAAPERSIDVWSMGRNLPALHRHLLDYASATGTFYYYDTAAVLFEVRDYREHRQMLAGLARRSRFFVCNRHPRTDIVVPRMFEGAAGGTVMFGSAPRSQHFQEMFDWPDAIVPFEPETGEVRELFEELSAQPERLRRIRRDNAVNCLLRHDYAYRWRQVYESAGVEVPPGFQTRSEMLTRLAAGCESLFEHNREARTTPGVLSESK